MSSDSLEMAARGFMQACIDLDPERISAFFAEDALAMYPIPHLTYGQEENRKQWAKTLVPGVIHPITVDEVYMSASNDLGYVFGRWRIAKPIDNFRAGGRYIAIWRPVNGVWLMQYLSAVVHEDISAIDPTVQL
jgi:ketosteroid isomerase-like protein